jgi:nitrogen fixation NifU-like protein
MEERKKKMLNSNVPKILNSAKVFDDFAKSLQAFIDEEEEELYSEKVRKEYRSPVNLGILKEPDGKARFTGPCGDTMEFYVSISNDSIKDIKFQTNGCGITVAAGSMLTRLVKGRKIKSVLAIEPEYLTNALDGLPPDNEHCSLLAVTTLRMAITEYLHNCGIDIKTDVTHFEDIIP